MTPNPDRTDVQLTRIASGRVSSRHTRRSVLRRGALVALGSVAGCLGRGPRQSTFDHPGAVNLEAQPRLGPPTSEAEATIVAFEDPSCPVCRIFEERTFPKLRTELLDTGTVAFFAREYPIVAPWGKTASRALEAVFARDGDAFWGLRSYYYAHQGEIVSDVLYDHTRRYLEDDTSLNVERVLGEVRRGGHEAAVRLDSTAAKDAGVKGTPTFLLFESGEYLTEIAGAPSYGMLENALDV